ncbi:histidine phosphatase family protein [Algoriphagus lacus]|uniref:Histidine phosphatase family protein n=1 Tax=Algoriphagus lacus TaxID=2056311 RepID=A0A418PNQ8_9BACT|nr:histidine phosphatase family protein [Algoriphagus lacus]RIW13599.1 histidine phosphatase family protein [Algoriphagus lacus]
MKKIILIRHAKSSWDNPWLSDHDRPLAERGINDAPKMAKRLKKRGIKPDLILSSTALRASETAKITAKELGYSIDDIVWEKNLFHGSPNTILKYIHMQKDSKNTILVFGHNPGFNELINFLGGDIENLPTCGQFGFKLKSEKWADLKPEKAEVWFFDFPKKKD